jgi:hypothetical protein
MFFNISEIFFGSKKKGNNRKKECRGSVDEGYGNVCCACVSLVKSYLNCLCVCVCNIRCVCVCVCNIRRVYVCAILYACLTLCTHIHTCTHTHTQYMHVPFSMDITAAYEGVSLEMGRAPEHITLLITLAYTQDKSRQEKRRDKMAREDERKEEIK